MRPSQLYQQKLSEHKLEVDAAQQALLPALDAVFENMVRPPKKRLFFRQLPIGGGVYLWGDVGRGKTMLMDVFFYALPETMTKRRVHFHAFMLEVHARLKDLRSDGHAHDFISEIAAHITAETRVICFDEFHVTDIADAMILGPLFTALFKEGAFIFATSNWHPDVLYRDGLQRARFLPFIDIVKQKMQVLHLASPVDHRLKALTQNGVYFLDGGTRFQTLFDSLTLSFAEAESAVDVGGRSLPAVALAADIGWFTFETLCMEPRGASDYLALANRCGTILLQNVPAMNDSRPDYAKRFMTLVDVLYDAQRVLVLGAHAPIAALYTGDRLAFEFERTKSRLIEMQHPDWFSHRLQTQALHGTTNT